MNTFKLRDFLLWVLMLHCLQFSFVHSASGRAGLILLAGPALYIACGKKRGRIERALSASGGQAGILLLNSYILFVARARTY